MQTNKKIRVLIAEDDYFVTETLKNALHESGYELAGEAANGEDAVKMTLSLKPDIVLMDIKMPQLDGLEATKRIQDRCPTPVVILTAYESQDLVKKAGEVGAAAYLIKPPKPLEIERAITIALARHNDLMELHRLNVELEKALAEIKTLRGIIPICASCKKIRDDKGYWNQIEKYIQDHTEANFSHGICPECAKKLYPEFVDENGNIRKKK